MIPTDRPRNDDAAPDRFIARLKDDIKAPEEAEARRLTQDIALAVQGALLVRFAPEAVAQAFCASRLDLDRVQAFGAPANDAGFAPTLGRAWPVSQ